MTIFTLLKLEYGHEAMQNHSKLIVLRNKLGKWLSWMISNWLGYDIDWLRDNQTV